MDAFNGLISQNIFTSTVSVGLTSFEEGERKSVLRRELKNQVYTTANTLLNEFPLKKGTKIRRK